MSFIEERIPFIKINGMLYVNEESTGVTCKDWVTNELGFTIEEWKDSIRGYFISGRIQFFTGNDYRKVSSTSVTVKLVQEVLTYYSKHFTDIARIFNGVIVAEDSAVWEPREELHIVS